MNRKFYLAAVFALALGTSIAMADAKPEATPDPATVPVEAPAEAPAEAAPAPAIEIPADIQSHIDDRFAGSEIKGITREGHTYVVELGDGSHVRYDNCCNPVCYGYHNHE